MKRYNQATATPGRVVSHRRIPTRAPTIHSDFSVPALTGLFVGVWGGFIMAMLFWMIFGLFWMPFGIFAATFVIVGFFVRVKINQGDIHATERIRRMPGEPEPEQLPMPEVKPPVLLNPYVGKERAEAEQRNADQEAFAAFVRECDNGGTSFAKWRREPMYADWRDRLIDSGWASWNNENEHRSGWKLNADAEHIIAALNGA